MEQILPVLLDHGLCNLTALSSVNKYFRKLVSGELNYCQVHDLRYLAKPNVQNRKRWIRLEIRGKVIVKGKTIPKPNSTWTVKIWKGKQFKALLTIEHERVTLDLTACSVTGSSRNDHRYIHPDPWIVAPLVFVRANKIFALYDDPSLAWLHQSNVNYVGYRQPKPPRFLRVAFGYLDIYSSMSSSSDRMPGQRTIHGFCSGLGFLNSLK